MELPLFPLNTVLCPGIALPLHVFEERYRSLVRHCLETTSPFGVVLIKQGREVGAGAISFTGIGTIAEIRQLGMSSACAMCWKGACKRLATGSASRHS